MIKKIGLKENFERFNKTQILNGYKARWIHLDILTKKFLIRNLVAIIILIIIIITIIKERFNKLMMKIRIIILKYNKNLWEKNYQNNKI